MTHEAWQILREAEEKAAQAIHRADDAQLYKLKAEEENKSLQAEMKQLEFELTKARPDTEVRLSVKKNKCKEKLEAAEVIVVKAFWSSIEFWDLKVEYGSASYLQGIKDFK